MVYLRIAERRIQWRKSARYRTHTAGSFGLLESVESKLLFYHRQVMVYRIFEWFYLLSSGQREGAGGEWWFEDRITFSLVCRYEATITAQFFGHTHFDEFELFYDPKDLGRAVGVSYICPSVTPFTNLNPGYRIYYVDGDRDHSTRVSLWEPIETK